MKKQIKAVILLIILLVSNANAQTVKKTPKKQLTPIMGWSSWNHFAVNINEDLIKKQADAMVATGLKNAGYQFINIDDGYFGGRDKNGNLKAHPTKFPSGMKSLATYIHAKGLKAGIYSEAGIITCGSMWNKDTIGVGTGMFGHDLKDIKLFFNDWKYDFLKVDWCGAQVMNLDEETRYTQISKLIYEIEPNAIYNVCRWQFPGKWVTNIADSWRISGDIQSKFKSIVEIIDLNADLWKYARPGHVNDMDMLQVGRGMTYEEDKTHFSMWCMMTSPLLAGNDLTKMSKETIAILTNKEMIAINQDPLVYQARKLKDYGEQEVWAKPLKSTISGEVAVALFNRGITKKTIVFNIDSVGIDAKKGFIVKNVWSKTISQKQTTVQQSFEVEPHGVVVLLISGTAIPYNVYQKK